MLTTKTYWSRRTADWGHQTGTMANNGAVTIVPTTTNQTIAVGYHNGSGYVEGDADLVADNIKQSVNIFGVDGTLSAGAAAGVPKTGQTAFYATGDDGDLEKGVAWPNPRFTKHGDGTVTDNLTGLIWLEDANCAGGKVSWATALSYSNALYDGCTSCFGGSTDCGLSDSSAAGDWRLPNVQEMQSLVHYGVYDPAVPNTAGTGKWTSGDPFTGVQSDSYWSSTTLAYYTDYAWHVYLYDGPVFRDDKPSTFYVWPIRGGQ